MVRITSSLPGPNSISFRRYLYRQGAWRNAKPPPIPGGGLRITNFSSAALACGASAVCRSRCRRRATVCRWSGRCASVHWRRRRRTSIDGLRRRCATVNRRPRRATPFRPDRRRRRTSVCARRRRSATGVRSSRSSARCGRPRLGPAPEQTATMGGRGRSGDWRRRWSRRLRRLVEHGGSIGQGCGGGTDCGDGRCRQQQAAAERVHKTHGRVPSGFTGPERRVAVPELTPDLSDPAAAGTRP